MTQNFRRPEFFTVFGGAYVAEQHGFSHGLPADESKRDSLANWGVMLATLLAGVTAVAVLTTSGWTTFALAAAN